MFIILKMDTEVEIQHEQYEVVPVFKDLVSAKLHVNTNVDVLGIQFSLSVADVDDDTKRQRPLRPIKCKLGGEVYSEVSGVTLDIMDPVSQFTDPVTGLTHYTFAGHLECASLPVPNGAVTDFSSVSWEGVQPICTVNWATDWDWKFLHVVLDEDVKDKRIVLDIQLALCHSDTEKYLNRRVRKYLHSGKDSICTLPSSAELKQVVVRPGRLAKLAPGTVLTLVVDTRPLLTKTVSHRDFDQDQVLLHQTCASVTVPRDTTYTVTSSVNDIGGDSDVVVDYFWCRKW